MPFDSSQPWRARLMGTCMHALCMSCCAAHACAAVGGRPISPELLPHVRRLPPGTPAQTVPAARVSGLAYGATGVFVFGVDSGQCHTEVAELAPCPFPVKPV